MRPKTILVAILAAAPAVPLGAPGLIQDDEPTPIQAAMGQMQGSQRAMRRLIKDPGANKAALLKATGSIQEAAIRAYDLAPPAPEGTDEHVWRIGFKREVLRTMDAALACELATHQGDAEALGSAYQALGASKKAGHDTYQR